MPDPLMPNLVIRCCQLRSARYDFLFKAPFELFLVCDVTSSFSVVLYRNFNEFVTWKDTNRGQIELLPTNYPRLKLIVPILSSLIPSTDIGSSCGRPVKFGEIRELAARMTEVYKGLYHLVACALTSQPQK